MLRIAVIGHVEHVTLGQVPSVPAAGEIRHLGELTTIPGGGGGVAFFQLEKSDAEVHLFSAVGDDAAGREVEAMLASARAHVHLARRATAHTRDVVMLTPGGERTIVVLGQPQHPTLNDALPWDVLGRCDAVYFTAQDPALIQAARQARLLVVSARRRQALVTSGVQADVVVGSSADEREASTLADYPVPPRYLVMTEGAGGGRIDSAAGVERFAGGRAPAVIRSTYGAGDSFAGALTYYLASGLLPAAACARAAEHGAAVLASPDTLAAQRRL